jgi:hypothetical protein
MPPYRDEVVAGRHLSSERNSSTPTTVLPTRTGNAKPAAEPARDRDARRGDGVRPSAIQTEWPVAPP